MVSHPARRQRRDGWLPTLWGAKALMVTAVAALLAGCASVETPRANLLDGRIVIKDLGDHFDCAPIAHSKAAEKVVFMCPGAIVIAKAGTHSRTVLQTPAYLIDPFVYREGQNTLLYLPVHGEAGVTIREIDVGAETMSERQTVLPDGFRLMSINLNPRDHCMVASLVAKGPFPYSGVIRVYDYDPRERTPVRLDGPSVIEVSQGTEPRHVGGPRFGGSICVRDKTGQIVLLRARFDRDDPPGGVGANIVRVTATDSRVIHRSPENMHFFQPKLAPYVYARNSTTPGLLKIDVDTGEVTTIGAKVEGLWMDFDPQSGLGAVLAPLPDLKVRLCVADLEGCRHSVRELHDGSFPSISNGWLGDGFITIVYVPLWSVAPTDHTAFYWWESQ